MYFCTSYKMNEMKRNKYECNERKSPLVPWLQHQKLNNVTKKKKINELNWIGHSSESKSNMRNQKSHLFCYFFWPKSTFCQKQKALNKNNCNRSIFAWWKKKARGYNTIFMRSSIYLQCSHLPFACIIIDFLIVTFPWQFSTRNPLNI